MVAVLPRDMPSCAAFGDALFVRGASLRKIGTGLYGSDAGYVYASSSCETILQFVSSFVCVSERVCVSAGLFV